MNVKPKFKPGTLGIGRQVSDALGPKSPPPILVSLNKQIELGFAYS